MTEADFAWLRDFLYRRSGLSLTVEKRYLVDSRLSTLCRRKGLATLSDLVGALRAGNEELIVLTVEAMTTNETLFFRDMTPFSQFRDLMLPTLLKARASERALRIWCAAASSGQEPYSLAMILDELADQLAGWRIEILATDISSEILAKAREGMYSQFEIQRGLPIQYLLKHFTQDGEKWRISDKLKRMVTFQQMNLIEPRRQIGPFDIIFCRNVLIYFDLPTKSQVMKTLAQSLRSDGFLSLGAAETVIGVTDAFAIDRENRGLYRPVPANVAAAANAPAPRPAAPLTAAAPAPAPAQPRAGMSAIEALQAQIRATASGRR
jgi:chemotaxis protein methyltransferase CheR